MDLQKELTKKDKMESLEERKLIIELFDKYQNFLPQSQKQAMYLRFFEDLSYSEIGEIWNSQKNRLVNIFCLNF